MTKLKEKALQFLKEEEGQSLSEYGLIIGIIAVACITVLVALKDKLVETFTKIKDAL
ncbi:Flp family type IVb pilin [Halalkalibacter alkalisediminis]|uniref:Flp family type IVb pilin n=1 Tax=Halalkalibacter alkalisediminis TaxID=935616 RepID=A0ABV6NMB4_9BACI|nr:Flp family type IVb pilin [Halalkalibacter alkalisediminis]